MPDRVGRSFALVAVLLPAVLLPSLAHAAADLPAIKVSQDNPVPECATPGRLMSFLKAQNGKFDPKFEPIATEYMRNGEELKIRWDIAFFQMMVETASLAYTGDVKPSQNNFAGLGATGGGARGESFPDVGKGARAHLQHVLMYTGEKVEDPVAERTRNVQEWGVLTSWQKGIKGPMTYSLLAKQWAPKTRGYATDIKFFADKFYAGMCNEPDPRPELVEEARAGQAQTVAAAAEPKQPTKGEEFARKAVEAARADGDAVRSGLGAGGLAKAASMTAEAAKGETPPLTILNPTVSAEAAPPGTGEAAGKGAPVETAGLNQAAVAAKAQARAEAKAAEKPASKCRVWQASYGGAKAVIIKASEAQQVNYTVLDVNDGSEKREADAYITAYAKGGETVGEFQSQEQALDKAFELCPEG